jgi:hypothetical protein
MAVGCQSKHGGGIQIMSVGYLIWKWWQTAVFGGRCIGAELHFCLKERCGSEWGMCNVSGSVRLDVTSSSGLVFRLVRVEVEEGRRTKALLSSSSSSLVDS